MTRRSQAHRVLALPVQGAGMCTAAGGLSGTLARWKPGAEAIGSSLLDAYDCVGDPVSAHASPVAEAASSQASDLNFMARVLPMLAAAAADLCERTALSLADLARERLFIVAPESERPSLGELWVRHAWMSLHGASTASAQQAMQQRISAHASVFDALSAAMAWLPASKSGVLVLCCESWLTYEALARLDDADLLCGPSSDGVVPGEAAVLLRLHASAATLRCAEATESEDRYRNERPLGTSISEALLALHAGTGEEPAAVLCDAHASQRAMARESEFLRQRHWPSLPPDGPAWLNGAVLGYIGHCIPLLQLAALAALPASDLPMAAYARSLWRQAWVSVRNGPPTPAESNALAAGSVHVPST